MGEFALAITECMHAGGEKMTGPKNPKVEKPKQPEFPVETFVNAYGFIRLNAKVLEAFGAEKKKKTNVTIDLQDNALIVRKV
jgi:hypothetical protein